ncbi:MAG: arabinose-5-phosphate isomerase [Arenicella sp.]|jgi:arabinose-5-phosphate isomerase
MTNKHLNEALKVFDLEAEAILQLKNQLTDDFSHAVEHVLASTGKVIICGMGKSGQIGQKIAATLASTGTASFFMHPAEAIHGDLGMVSANDVFVAISNSGETDEVIRLIPFLHENGNCIIAITGKPNSTLAVNANYHLNVCVEKEACPLQLAPTSSTTAALAMGDAFAVAIMVSRKFQPENFAKFHPGGSLGRKLLTKVKDVMRVLDLPFVRIDASISEIIKQISSARLGMTMVGDKDNFLGIITDGDIRRFLEIQGEKFHLLNAADMMTKHPKNISPSEKILPAIEKMNLSNITVLPVLEQNKVVGVLHLYDCEL